MPDISTGIRQESSFLNLRAIRENEIRPEVFDLMVGDERVAAAFRTVRDQVIFTTRRIFVVNVQGLTGKKVSYFSYPYAKVQYFGVETAGLLDVDSEMLVAFSDGAKLTFDFSSGVDIRRLSAIIAGYAL